jgi:hypothetical protein
MEGWHVMVPVLAGPMGSHARTDTAHTLDASEGQERMWVELHCTTPGRGIEDRKGRVPWMFCCKAE